MHPSCGFPFLHILVLSMPEYFPFVCRHFLLFPTTNGGTQKWRLSRNVRTSHTCFGHVWRPVCVLSRCLSTSFLRRRSVGSLLRVRCWLGPPSPPPKKILITLACGKLWCARVNYFAAAPTTAKKMRKRQDKWAPFLCFGVGVVRVATTVLCNIFFDLKTGKKNKSRREAAYKYSRSQICTGM